MILLMMGNSKTTIRSFKYKTEIIGRTSTNNTILDTKVAAPLKYLSNF